MRSDFMKLFLLFLSMCFSIPALAGSGTTFCPHPTDFKYDKTSGMMVAPGGWEFAIGGPAKVRSFIKVEASDLDGSIFDCRYVIHVYGQTFPFPVQAEDYDYVADNIHSSVWHKGAAGMFCKFARPEKCRFHLG